MRVAVCDDDKLELEYVAGILENYKEKGHAELCFGVYESAVELFSEMEHTQYDLLFLDVLMPGLDGYHAAEEIRKKDEFVKIVFLTSTPEFAVQSYRVRAMNYLLKPVSGEEIFSVIDEVAAELLLPQRTLVLRDREKVYALAYEKMEYIEIIAKVLYFHMADKKVHTIRASLAVYEPLLLAQPGFFKIHRSCIVNFRMVSEIGPNELVTAGGEHLPIARAVRRQARVAYTEYLFKNGMK